MATRKVRLPKGLRVSRTGSGIQIRVYVKGKDYSETLKGDFSKDHIAAAVKRRAHIEAQLTHGEFGLAFQNFEDIAQEWMNTLDVKRSTSISYAGLLNKYWLPHFEGKKLASINAPAIKRVLAHYDTSNKTKKNALVCLSAIFAYAEVTPNPCRNVKIKRNQKAPVERYSPVERKKLLDTLQDEYRVFFAVMFGTGLRTGECCGLRWEDYDGEYLHINKQVVRRRLENYTKTSVIRKVLVPTWVRKHLNTLPSRFAGDFIFPNENDSFHRDTDPFLRRWKAAHKKARIRYRIPYVCRHTRAAELLSIGVVPAAAAKQLGHSVQMFLDTYSEFIEEYAGDMAILDTPLQQNAK